MNDFIKDILKSVKVEPGKTFDLVKKFEEGQVWGREEEFWLISNVSDTSFEYIHTKFNETKYMNQKNTKWLAEYFLRSPREKTYGEIFDDRIIEQLFFKYDENTKSYKELFSKKAYSNGKNKIFISFYNSNEIYQIQELQFNENFKKNFNIDQPEINIKSFYDELKNINEIEMEQNFELIIKEIRLGRKPYSIIKISDEWFLFSFKKDVSIKFPTNLLHDKIYIRENAKISFEDFEKKVFIIKDTMLMEILKYNNLKLSI